MVTFRKVDPVYSFDLSDPTNPQVTGELKIPGYSDYLQLIDEDHLLAIGRGTIDSNSPRFAWFQEVQVSLFNISDMENPTLLHRYSFEGGRSGQSEALVDHHAFNYLPDHKILAVPFSSGEGHSWEAGLITLKIDPKIILIRGSRHTTTWLCYRGLPEYTHSRLRAIIHSTP